MAMPVAAGEIAAADLDRLPDAQIVILGEVHDDPAHHANQARAVRAIRPEALVFEMLTPSQVAGAEGIDRSDAARLGIALGWAGTGWPDFALYAPIFAAAEAEIYGAGLPDADVARAMTDGAAAVFGVDADSFGLAAPLAPAEAAAREAAQKAVHCGMLPDGMLPGMVAAQRLRDASFARTALRALEETGGPVVVITGNGHAERDQGIPVYLAAAAPDVRVLSVGQVETVPGEAAPDDPPFDLWLATPEVIRPDPCEGFTVPSN